MKSHALMLTSELLLLSIAAATAGGQTSLPVMNPRIDAAASEPAAQLRADVRLERTILQSGQPLWAHFSLTNLTDRSIPLQVPDAEPSDQPRAEMGLPLSHVFSGKGFSGISMADSRGDFLDDRVTRKPVGPVPVVHLAPRASVGIRVDLAQYYDMMARRPGKYSIVWRPYGGSIESEPVHVTVLAEQQAIILTDQGRIVVRFYYEQAPRHVQNFIDLINQRFYDNLTFHRVVAGNIVQGGDPRGDGKGIRPDGRRLQGEFSKIPFEAGTVGMARSSRDPDSASCQFFICLSRQAAFDGQQTAFGYLVGQESFDTLTKIASMPTGAKDRPIKPVYIRAISLESVPPRDRETSGVTTSSGSRPSVVQRDLEPTPTYRGESPLPPNGPDFSPARRLSRAPRLLASTQPAGQ